MAARNRAITRRRASPAAVTEPRPQESPELTHEEAPYKRLDTLMLSESRDTLADLQRRLMVLRGHL